MARKTPPATAPGRAPQAADPACPHYRRNSWRDGWICLDCPATGTYAPPTVTGTVTIPRDAAPALAAWVTAHGGTWTEDARGAVGPS
jgi:hypothetical protein